MLAKARIFILRFRISIRAQLMLWLCSLVAGFVVFAGAGDPRLIFFSPFLFVAVNLLPRLLVFWMRTSGRDFEV